ncbi:carbohydrate ABC transporter permease [Tengunoibacter tsumagoiensis]|uniref:Sugar ABC transporter permease n=1 Tax=Tengunoibacter tsumagoiensis TaxID=2014871 RepID=A0A401ZTK3_9CHLR|nr:carbohydrate ABC transporter permease [Tengunoibacter tsumagoiensis]GCE10197.1 sugar ABC transporter permease [Tengunoibacter tsumagoiensis]
MSLFPASSPLTAGQKTPALVRRERLSLVGKIVWYSVCALLSLTMLFPLLWMLSIALKGNGDIHQVPPQFFPKEFHFENFILGPQQIHFPLLFLNTAIITLLSTVGSVLSSMIVGYGLSRIQFPGRQIWFYVFIGSIFVPPLIGLLPIVRLAINLGFYDTWLPLILPAWLANPLYIFLFRQYSMSIPFSLDEAAKLDGAGHWSIFWRVMVPLTRPVWMTMAIMAFQASWNDYLNPLVYLTSDDKFTLSLGMGSFAGQFAGVANTQYNYFMATNLLYMLPPLLLFFFAQRYFMQGLGALGSVSQK